MWSTSAGNGASVVLIHGGFSDYRYWELQQITYAQYYRAIAVSLSGYYPDRSTVHDPLSAERHIEEIGDFLKSLGEFLSSSRPFTRRPDRAPRCGSLSGSSSFAGVG